MALLRRHRRRIPGRWSARHRADNLKMKMIFRGAAILRAQLWGRWLGQGLPVQLAPHAPSEWRYWKRALDPSIQATVAPALAPGLEGLPRSNAMIALVGTWILFGLTGHDPWKPDEAHYFGVVLDFLRSGDWVVPTLAGEPFVEKPPLFYIVAGSLAQIADGVLPLHDAARLATGVFVAIALLFLGRTARTLYGPGYGTAAVLVMIGCLGTVARLHQLITDVALFAGISIAIYGLAVARERPLAGGAALGLGGACAFLSKGFVGPVWLAMAALSLAIFRAWRTRPYFLALGCAFFIALIPSMIWIGALYARSPWLFVDWFVNNNLGRFFGFSHLGTRNPPGFYAVTLVWYALPALPLAIYAAWMDWRNREETAALPALQLAVTLIAVMAVVLGLATDSRDLYLMPMMLPLSLLAARGVALFPIAGTHVLSNSARWALAAFAALLWLAWLALLTGLPAPLQDFLLSRQPGFEPYVQWIPMVLAIVATFLGAPVLLPRARTAGRALSQWAVAATLCWVLIATLWTPYLDAGKSYRSMIQSLARELPADGCVASRKLGEPQRGLLMYYAGIKTIRLEMVWNASCPALLVQGFRDRIPPPPSDEWTLVWEGARPGDQNELYRLYRRDVAHVGAIARFP